MEIIKIDKTHNSVTIFFKDYVGEYKITLTKRFLVTIKSRWNFFQERLIRYFIDSPHSRGVLAFNGADFINSYSIYHQLIPPSNIEIFDLKCIHEFSDVEFEDNKNELYNEVHSLVNISFKDLNKLKLTMDKVEKI
jgi:hypothetical protein